MDFRLCLMWWLVKDAAGAGSNPHSPLPVVYGEGYVANMERVDDALLRFGRLRGACLVGKDVLLQFVVQPLPGIVHKHALVCIEAKNPVEVV